MKLKLFVAAAALAAAYSPVRAQGDDALGWDIYPDTWVGADGVGRLQPTADEVGQAKTDKKRDVGIFYVTWHTRGCHNGEPPYTGDVTKILEANPATRIDGTDEHWGKHGSYHWGEPELGYFLSADPYVIRHDVSALSDAGVDVLILDVTNSVRYWEEWEQLFKILEEMKGQGQRVPKFCFWVFNGIPVYCAQEIYDKLYRTGRYKDLWYCRDGKPLLLYNADPHYDSTGNPRYGKLKNYLYDPAAAADAGNPHHADTLYTQEFIDDYPQYIKDFFSLRNMWWGYYKWDGKRFLGGEDNWSFGLDLGDTQVQGLSPRERTSRHKGELEEIAVTPAQHPVWLVGKSWRIGTGEPQLDEHDMPVPTYVPELGKVMPNPTDYGIYFQDRWDEAIGVDPSFIYLNDWSEWTAGKFLQNPRVTFMRRPATNYYFVDQYNKEFNRTIGPMKGGHTDNYYMQMAANIRRYKGVRPVPRNHGYFSSWDALAVEYRDTRGDTAHRDFDGYSGLHYRDTLGRNDILLTKVGVSRRDVMFRVSAAGELTKPEPQGWMLLFIDADADHSTGWNGYDYMVQDGKLLRAAAVNADGSAEWKPVASVATLIDGKDFYVSIPRKLIGAKGRSVAFDFKWADNPADLKSPIGLALGGDTAPNRRFNYRFLWSRE